MKKNLRILFTLSTAILTSGLRAENLTPYRDSLKITEESQKQGLERVNRIRAHMGTSGLSFTAMNSQKELFFEAKSAKSHRLNRSLFTKLILDKAMEALKLDSQWQVPAGLGDKEKRERHLAVCKQVIGDDMSKIVDYFAVMGQAKRDAAELAKENPAPVVAPVDKNNVGAARTAAIASYIAANDPLSKDSEGKATKITDILGELTGVGMVDGYVSDLYFDNLEEVALTLSMITTFRAGEDSLYIKVVDCVGDFVRTSIESYSKQEKDNVGNEKLVNEAKYNLDILHGVDKFVTETYKESLAIHEIVSALSRAQQNHLIDLFLQLNVKDIPAETEIKALKDHWIALGEAGKGNPVDFQYYVVRHEQLQRLEDKLYDEKERERIEAKMKAIQGGGK